MNIYTKRENFRQKVRKEAIEKEFEKKRKDIYPYPQPIKSEPTSLHFKFEELNNNKILDFDELSLGIQTIQSTTDEQLIVSIMQYIELFNLKDLPYDLPEIFINKLKETNQNRLKFYVIQPRNQQFIMFITNMINQEDQGIWNSLAEKNLIKILVEILQDFQEIEIMIFIVDFVSIWPKEFMKMHPIQDQIDLMVALQQYSKYNTYCFYKILIKLTQDIDKEHEIFQMLVEYKFIQKAIDDFNNKQHYVVEFFINLTFLDNESLNPIITFNLLSAIIFELNKPNNVQSSLYMLIRNLLLTDYSIRMLFYNFSIFSHLCYGIEYSLQQLDLNSLEEILTCLQILFQNDEMSYANHKKQIVESEIERQIQAIFNCLDLYNTNIYTQAAQVLIFLYAHFPFNRNKELVEKISLVCNLIDTEIYESLMNCICQYEQ